MPQDLILVVEDDAAEAHMLCTALAAEKYPTACAYTCAQGWSLTQSQRPSLVIIDVTLPDASGLDLCRKIRAHRGLCATPVIMLTARSRMKDKELGFASGADHYLTKPFPIAELHLWVESLLRRTRAHLEQKGVIRFQNLSIDPATHRVRARGRAIPDLTPREFDLVYLLARHSPKVLSKKDILSKLWKRGPIRDNTVEVHIRNIRKKLDAAADCIETISGVGYRFATEPTKTHHGPRSQVAR